MGRVVPRGLERSVERDIRIATSGIDEDFCKKSDKLYAGQPLALAERLSRSQRVRALFAPSNRYIGAGILNQVRMSACSLADMQHPGQPVCQ